MLSPRDNDGATMVPIHLMASLAIVDESLQLSSAERQGSLAGKQPASQLLQQGAPAWNGASS